MTGFMGQSSGRTLKPTLRVALNDFAMERGLDPTSERASERFVAQLLLHDLGFADFDIEQIVAGGMHDNQIDALAIAVNQELVVSVDELEAALASLDDEDEAEILFLAVQVTMSDRWESSKIHSFGAGVRNFFEVETLTPENDRLAALRVVKDHVLLWAQSRSVSPDVSLRLIYAAANDNPPDTAILGACENERRAADRLGLFGNARFELVDGYRLEQLCSTWRAAQEATLRMGGLCALPAAEHMPRAWLGWAKATDYLRLVASPAGGIRRHVFVENVRIFLGIEGSSVNEQIAETVRGQARSEFVFRNNGVTIVARSAMEIEPGLLALRGYQIVNGCQTSCTLYAERAHLTEEVTLPIKIVETQERSAIREITMATNRQTPVDDAEFLSQLPFVRELANLFWRRRVHDPGVPLWLERRRGELQEQQANAPHQVLSIVTLLETYLGAFEQRPHAVHNHSWRPLLKRIDRGTVLGPHDEAALYYACGMLHFRATQYASQSVSGQRAKTRRRHGGHPARHHLAFAAVRLAAPELPPLLAPTMPDPLHGGALERLVDLLKDRDEARILFRRADSVVSKAMREQGGSSREIQQRVKTSAMTEAVLAGIRTLDKEKR